jgi:MFS family permease
LTPATSPAVGVRRDWTSIRVIATSSAALALTAPGQTAAISAFVNPLQRGLHLSSSAVSGAYLIGSLAGAWTMPLLGRAIDRWGPRTLMAIIGAVFGAVLLALSTVTGVVGLTAGFIGIRMAGQGALNLVATTTVALYVTRRRGLAQGITAAVGGAGISLAPVLLEGAVADHGFRQVWLWEGLIIWTTVIPLALFALPRRRPGVAPAHGKKSGALDPRSSSSQAVEADASWTLREAMRTGMFWLVTGGVAVTGTMGTALAFHQIDILGERGLSPAMAAANFLPQTAAGLLATLLTGYLADRVADRVLISAAMLVLVVALVAACYVGPGWGAIGYAVAVGTAGNSIRTLEATAFPNCFGLAHIGAIRGVVHTAAVAATAFGPLAFSLGRDASSSYRPVLLTAALVPAAVAALAPFVRPPVPRTTGTRTRTEMAISHDPIPVMPADLGGYDDWPEHDDQPVETAAADDAPESD